MFQKSNEKITHLFPNEEGFKLKHFDELSTDKSENLGELYF